MIDIKEIAPYLPYGLKWAVKQMDGSICISKMTTVQKDGEGIDILFIFNDNEKDYGWLSELSDNHFDIDLAHKQYCKPILHPLSELTKEITVSGETFVPLERLFNSYKKHYGFDFCCVNDFDIWCFNGLGEISTESLTLNKYLKLLEWHFDVFGLIERGHAIDINTLKQER